MEIKRLRSRMRAESMRPTGRTIAQLSALERVIEFGPVTTSALAQLEHVKPQSAAEVVAALKSDGLLRGHPDPTDGRKTLLTITDAGLQVIATAMSFREAWLARAIVAAITPDELPTLATAIGLLKRLSECELEAAGAEGWRG